jgi:hypothetical protein
VKLAFWRTILTPRRSVMDLNWSMGNRSGRVSG